MGITSLVGVALKDTTLWTRVIGLPIELKGVNAMKIKIMAQVGTVLRVD